MSKFHNSNLLYRPSLSIWTARKKDKGESAKVTQDNGAQTGAANVYKALLPENPKLEAVRKWGDGFRDFIYTNSLPWDDSGWRIGRADRHMEFMAQAGDKIREGEALVEEFMAEYRVAIENAKFTLANLFDPSDYPGEQEVRAKFRFTLDVTTLPNAEDFRIVDGVPQDEVDKLVGIAKNSVETRVQKAMDVAYEKLYEVVAKMASTLEQYGGGQIKKFNDTLVGNIAELVDAMPALNITGDPKLASLASKARELSMYAAADLRKDENVRKAAIIEAKALAKEFKPEPAYDGVTTHPEFGPRPVDASVFADMLTEA
jgi:hypothetical protein